MYPNLILKQAVQAKANYNSAMPDNFSKRPDPTQPTRTRRPFLLTLVLGVFALWTFLGWLRFFGTLKNQALILELLPAWAFWYLLLAGMVWGLVGIPVLWGLILRAGWTLEWLFITALIYPLVYWLERLLLWQSPVAGSNWPFMLFLTLIWLGLVVWSNRSAKVRRYFGDLQEKD